MTILCLALGNPVPHVKLYVGGHLVREETTRHLVTTVHNISVDMEHISCYADNGKTMKKAALYSHLHYFTLIYAIRLWCANANIEEN